MSRAEYDRFFRFEIIQSKIIGSSPQGDLLEFSTDSMSLADPVKTLKDKYHPHI